MSLNPQYVPLYQLQFSSIANISLQLKIALWTRQIIQVLDCIYCKAVHELFLSHGSDRQPNNYHDFLLTLFVFFCILHTRYFVLKEYDYNHQEKSHNAFDNDGVALDPDNGDCTNLYASACSPLYYGEPLQQLDYTLYNRGSECSA